MARDRWKLGWAVAALVLIGSACSGGGGGQSSGESKEPITIGASLPLTGEFSQPGGAAKRGYDVWAEMVNEKGGILGRQVKLTILDDASEQNTVVADYNRLITRDKVDLLLGTFSSLLNLPASAVAERNRMVYVEPAGGAPAMFERGFHYLFFAQQATAPHQADVFVDWVKSLPAGQRPKTAAYPTQDDPFAKPVIDTMRKALEAAGVKTVYATVYPPETTNFDTIANTIKARNPDLVAQGAVFEDGVGLVRSLIKAGFSPQTLFQTSAPSNSDQYAKGVGEANTEGVFYTVSWNEKATTPGNEEFVAEYGKRFDNAIPAEDAADAYAAAQVLQKAAEEVGSFDQVKMAEWLHQNEVETILGPLSWDETGAPQGDFLLAQWQNGAVEIVAPEDAATVDSAVEKTPWQ
jgi:branched-chain amino acid transport system substrate-binding protein